MTQEELLLEYWRNLSPQDRERVFAVVRSLGDTDQKSSQRSTTDAPEHLKFGSSEQLDRLLLQGIDSLDRGDGVEVNDDWWLQERARLVNKQGLQK